jgi:hypothetical protein
LTAESCAWLRGADPSQFCGDACDCFLSQSEMFLKKKSGHGARPGFGSSYVTERHPSFRPMPPCQTSGLLSCR